MSLLRRVRALEQRLSPRPAPEGECGCGGWQFVTLRAGDEIPAHERCGRCGLGRPRYVIREVEERPPVIAMGEEGRAAKLIDAAAFNAL